MTKQPDHIADHIELIRLEAIRLAAGLSELMGIRDERQLIALAQRLADYLEGGSSKNQNEAP